MIELQNNDLNDFHALLLISEGLGLISGGICLTVLLYLGALQIVWLQMIPQVPAFLAGELLILWGCLRMWPTRKLSPNWQQLVTICTIFSAGSVYFSLFFHWWRVSNTSVLLTINGLVFLLFFALLIRMVNRLVEDVAYAVGQQGLGVEALIYGWMVVFLTWLPVGAMVIVAVWHSGGESTILSELTGLAEQMPVWLRTVATLPLLLTMLCCARMSAVLRLRILPS